MPTFDQVAVNRVGPQEELEELRAFKRHVQEVEHRAHQATVYSLNVKVEELKADISQLETNYVLSLEANQQQREKIEAQAKLITELADALDRSDPIQISIQEIADLIDRAREATK